MLKKALGLIETEGLACAIEAADAAVKSADVSLVGYELTKGGGLVTVKVIGEVSAVQAAVSSASAAAARIGSVYSVRVIPRPAPGLEMMVFTDETVGYEKQTPAPAPLAICTAADEPLPPTEETTPSSDMITETAETPLREKENPAAQMKKNGAAGRKAKAGK